MAKKRRRASVWFMKKSRAQAWLEQAAFLMNEDDPEGAVQILNRVARMVPPDSLECVEATNLMGISLMCMERFDLAFQALSFSAECLPDAPFVLYLRGVAGFCAERSCQSLIDLEDALQLAEGDETLIEDTRTALAASRRMVEIELLLRGEEFTFQRLCEIQEIYWQARICLDDGKYARAEGLLRRAIALDCDAVPEIWGHLGFCLMRQDRLEEAEDAFRRSLEIQEDYHPAKWGLEQLARQGAEKDFAPGSGRSASAATSAA